MARKYQAFHSTRRALIRALAAAAMIGVAQAAPAPDPQAVLAKLFQAPSLNAAWFAPSFRARIPVGQVQAIFSQVKDEMGDFKSAEPSGGQYIVHLARGAVTAKIALDGAGLVTLLLIRPVAE